MGAESPGRPGHAEYSLTVGQCRSGGFGSPLDAPKRLGKEGTLGAWGVFGSEISESP